MATSLTAAFPGEHFSTPQYQLLALISSGEDVRAWQVANYQSLLALIGRRVVEAEATTGRLYLLTAEAIAVHLAAVERRIKEAEAEVEELDAAIEIGARVLAAALERVGTEADAVARHAANPARVAASRAAHAEALVDLAEQRAADQRRRARIDTVSAGLRDLRRERLRLELAAVRRGATTSQGEAA